MKRLFLLLFVLSFVLVIPQTVAATSDFSTSQISELTYAPAGGGWVECERECARDVQSCLHNCNPSNEYCYEMCFNMYWACMIANCFQLGFPDSSAM